MENRFKLTAGEMVATIKGKKDANQKILSTWELGNKTQEKLQFELEIFIELLELFEKKIEL